MQTNTMLDEFIWAQKWRPKKIDDCILPESTKTLFKGYIAKGKLPHFLFASTQGGMGKCLDYNTEITVYVNDEDVNKFM